MAAGLKLLAAAFLLFAAPGQAQQVPNPMSRDGRNATAPVMTDSKTGAYTGDAAGLTILSKPGISAMDVANITCNNCGYTNYDAIRGVAVANVDANVVNTNAIAGYIRNQSTTSGLSRNAVALIGYATGEIDYSATWGLNTVNMDSNIYVKNDLNIGRAVIGYEADFNIMSANTEVAGIFVIGGSLSQPTIAKGIGCKPLSDPHGSVPNPVHWTSCFYSDDGAAEIGLALGALDRSGTNVGGQAIRLSYTDEAAAMQHANLQITGGLPRTLLLSTTGGDGTLGFGVPGDIYIRSQTGNLYMGAPGAPGSALGVTDTNVLYVGNGPFTNLVIGSNTPIYLNVAATTAAGTGKRFVCIDNATNQLFRSTGASCN